MELEGSLAKSKGNCESKFDSAGTSLNEMTSNSSWDFANTNTNTIERPYDTPRSFSNPRSSLTTSGTPSAFADGSSSEYVSTTSQGFADASGKDKIDIGFANSPKNHATGIMGIDTSSWEAKIYGCSGFPELYQIIGDILSEIKVPEFRKYVKQTRKEIRKTKTQFKHDEYNEKMSKSKRHATRKTDLIAGKKFLVERLLNAKLELPKDENVTGSVKGTPVDKSRKKKKSVVSMDKQEEIKKFTSEKKDRKGRNAFGKTEPVGVKKGGKQENNTSLQTKKLQKTEKKLTGKKRKKKNEKSHLNSSVGDAQQDDEQKQHHQNLLARGAKKKQAEKRQSDFIQGSVLKLKRPRLEEIKPNADLIPLSETLQLSHGEKKKKKKKKRQKSTKIEISSKTDDKDVKGQLYFNVEDVLQTEQKQHCKGARKKQVGKKLPVSKFLQGNMLEVKQSKFEEIVHNADFIPLSESVQPGHRKKSQKKKQKSKKKVTSSTNSKTENKAVKDLKHRKTSVKMRQLQKTEKMVTGKKRKEKISCIPV